MDGLLLLKWLHILSSTVLFGTGLGTAFFMWSAHRSNDPETIARVAGFVVRADWIFTLPSGILQPLTGLLLARASGYDLTERWLLWTYALYVVALACWIPVVGLQIRMRDFAREAATLNRPLPPDYERAARRWFWLGWPAFISLLIIFYLMVARPA
jgi:uncharacterized membrane protein